MDELLALVQSLHEKVDSLREEIDELKGQQRPMTSKDYTFSLKNSDGLDFDEWIGKIKINAKDVETLLLKSNKNCEKIDKNYIDILIKLSECKAMKVFDSNKNTIYIFKKNKWITMKKEDIEKLQNKVQTKLRERFRKMIKEKNSLLNNETIADFSYMEQRNKISQVSTVTHTVLKNDLYKILTSSSRSSSTSSVTNDTFA